jgi:hypothetical protein
VKLRLKIGSEILTVRKNEIKLDFTAKTETFYYRDQEKENLCKNIL